MNVGKSTHAFITELFSIFSQRQLMLRAISINVFLLAMSIFSMFISEASAQFSEKILQHVAMEYGANAEKRLRLLNSLILDNMNKPVSEKLNLVNTTMNKLPWLTDQQHWKQADYWATPLETVTTFGGDCEDIAIAKWVVLRLMGIPDTHLRLAYVKIKRTSESHMVLLYVENPLAPPKQQRPLVLDNYINEVKKGKERKDLLAVYLFDAKGNMILFADNGKERTIKGVYEQRNLKKLNDLKQVMSDSRSKYKELNDGIPLLPEFL
jgi:predicted transglutaminase-like cysteine proteinase